MVRLTPLDILGNIVSKVENFSLKDWLNKIERHLEKRSSRISHSTKVNSMRIIVGGSLLLFLISYNIAEDQQNYNNETPMGIFTK